MLDVAGLYVPERAAAGSRSVGKAVDRPVNHKLINVVDIDAPF